MTYCTTNYFSPQSKIEAYQRVERILETGPFDLPGFPRCVHRAHFLHSLFWSQAGARICEMNDLGWSIASVKLPKHLWRRGVYVAYRLDSKPLQSGEPFRAVSLQSHPLKSWEQVCAERDEKLRQPEPEFELLP